VSVTCVVAIAFPEVACAAAATFITVIAPGNASSIPISVHSLGFQCIIVLLVPIPLRPRLRFVISTESRVSSRHAVERSPALSFLLLLQSLLLVLFAIHNPVILSEVAHGTL